MFLLDGKLSYDCATHTEKQTSKTSKFAVIKQKNSEIPQDEHFVSDLDSWEQYTAVGVGKLPIFWTQGNWPEFRK